MRPHFLHLEIETADIPKKCKQVYSEYIVFERRCGLTRYSEFSNSIRVLPGNETIQLMTLQERQREMCEVKRAYKMTDLLVMYMT